MEKTQYKCNTFLVRCRLSHQNPLDRGIDYRSSVSIILSSLRAELAVFALLRLQIPLITFLPVSFKARGSADANWRRKVRTPTKRVHVRGGWTLQMFALSPLLCSVYSASAFEEGGRALAQRSVFLFESEWRSRHGILQECSTYCRTVGSSLTLVLMSCCA